MNKCLLLLTLTGLLFFKCSSQDTKPFLQLSTFAAIPKEIDGCEGDYSYDTTSLKKNKYILITNLQGLAMIRVNGKTISLHQISQSQPAKHTRKEEYKGSGYRIILTMNEIKQTGEEVIYETGTLQIQYGNTNTIYKIHGKAGC